MEVSQNWYKKKASTHLQQQDSWEVSECQATFALRVFTELWVPWAPVLTARHAEYRGCTPGPAQSEFIIGDFCIKSGPQRITSTL